MQDNGHSHSSAAQPDVPASGRPSSLELGHEREASLKSEANGASESLTAWEIASGGTYVDVSVPKPVMVIVLALSLVMALAPSVGMLWARTDATSENRVLADVPHVIGEDGAFNWNVLADAGAYFEDHFAFRNDFVAANARLRAMFGASSTDQVVIGTEGWLYYGGTLPDYLGQTAMSERELRNIAHNLRLAQSYVEAQGAQFAFALSPNKNQLYPDHMPYYYLKSPGESNASRLVEYLDAEGVNYVDLFGLFKDAQGEWYLMRDSHWDNRGALMAAQEMLAAAGHDLLDYDVSAAEPRDDFVGDLEGMLYPAGARTEINWYFPGVNDQEGMAGAAWAFTEGSTVTDSFIRTVSANGTGSVFVFRDSFGNALLPYFATAYEQAAFSKLVPYNLTAFSDLNADTVIIERAERHLDYLATDPPIMPAPRVKGGESWPKDVQGEMSAALLLEEDGRYWKLSGTVSDDVMSPDSSIYISIEGADGKMMALVPFWLTVKDEAVSQRGPAQSTTDDDAEGTVAGHSTDNGFRAYVAQSAFDPDKCTIRVYAASANATVCVGSFSN